MSRSALRVLVGVGMLLSIGAMFAPSLWQARAEALRGAGNRAGASLLAAGAATTQPFVTSPLTSATTARITTLPPTTATTAPPFSSVSLTPTPMTRPVTTSSRPRVSTTAATTTSTSTTTTTIVPISGGSTPAPVTLPLASEPQSATISAFFPILSAVGFVALLVLAAVQAFLTRPGSNGPTL